MNEYTFVIAWTDIAHIPEVLSCWNSSFFSDRKCTPGASEVAFTWLAQIWLLLYAPTTSVTLANDTKDYLKSHHLSQTVQTETQLWDSNWISHFNHLCGATRSHWKSHFYHIHSASMSVSWHSWTAKNQNPEIKHDAESILCLWSVLSVAQNNHLWQQGSHFTALHFGLFTSVVRIRVTIATMCIGDHG